jgi:hypothetical protein
VLETLVDEAGKMKNGRMGWDGGGGDGGWRLAAGGRGDKRKTKNTTYLGVIRRSTNTTKYQHSM